MFRDKNPEVLVVGAGPVGMLAALSLARRGLTVEIVDTGVWPCQHSYALALHAASIDLLDQFELAAAARAGSYGVKTLALCDRNGEKQSAPMREVYVTRQDALETLLEGALRQAGIEINWRHEVFSLEPGTDAVSVTVNRLAKESRGYGVAHTEWVVEEQKKIDVPFVVGADGYNSQVRRALGIAFPEVAPADYYAVFEFDTDADLEHSIRVVFGAETTDVLWPLPGGCARWSFQLPGYSDPRLEEMKDRLFDAGLGYFPTERTKDRTSGSPGDDLPMLDESELGRLVKERAPWFAGKIGNVTWKTLVRFEKRQVDSFGSGRMWLAGDAAHLAGPAAIQSMNSGLLEANDLAGRIAAVLKQGSPLSGLGSYTGRWSRVWERIRAFRATPEASPFVKQHGAKLASSLPASGDDLNALAEKFGLTF